MNKVHFSSELSVSENPRDCCATPQALVDALGKPFGGFTVDACAAAHNAKCARFWTRQDNGLEQSWSGERVWCNPPYSDIEPWVHKAIESQYLYDPAIVCMLLPNRTASEWFLFALQTARRVQFVRSPRIQFLPPPGVPESSARHDALVLFFGPEAVFPGRRVQVIDRYGKVLSA